MQGTEEVHRKQRKNSTEMANLSKGRDAKPRSKWPSGHMTVGLPRLKIKHRKGKPVERQGHKVTV